MPPSITTQAPPELERKKPFFTAIDRVASFPDVMIAIRSAVSEETSAPPVIARCVERDVAFASRLLRIVNAPAIGLIRPCASVEHAVSLLGRSRVGLLAEEAASRAAVEQCAAIAPDLAKHATAHASIARALAPLVNASPEQAFTATLLSNIGLVAILAVDEGEGAPKMGSVEGEREHFGFDHMELGAEILERWHMPSPIPDVVARHHDLGLARERSYDVERLVAILQAAEALAPLVVDGPDEAPDAEVLGKLMAEHPAFAVLGPQLLDVDKLRGAWPALRASLRSEEQQEEAPAPSDDVKSAPPRPASTIPDPFADLARLSRVPPRRKAFLSAKTTPTMWMAAAAVIVVPAALAAFALLH